MASVFPADQAIVVGGGLAGMSAANTVLENGGRVVLLDKSSFCGGNSTKATSGINGANTRTQRNQGIDDSSDLFTADTLKGGAKKPELAKVLCENSGADVEWLMDKFNLDLSLVARLGGHSAPRTHRGKERFPGMTITYALIQMVEKIAEKTDKARIVTKACVKELIMSNGACTGCVYLKGGADYREFGPVIFATGGFGADFTNDSLLAMYRPDLMHLPTTNGEHCTGDGIKLGEAVGAKTIDLEWVQVHPTGLVKPDDPDAKIKFLAAEALRGVGGLVLNANGDRFCNELGRRDYVTGEMWKNKPPFRLALNRAASEEIAWHCKHYTGRGVMKFYESGEHLAKDMGIAVSKLEDTMQKHYEASQKTAKDPDGGPFPAYPSGKSWDNASGVTGSGKKFYHNVIPGSAVKKEPFYVAIITPVIHYCMGGLEIDGDSAVLGQGEQAIPGLYAAGEVAGGVHGNNRLGGNSLLDCVVFGRVAGLACARYMLGDDMKQTSLSELSGGGLSGNVESSKLAGGSYEDTMNSAKVQSSAAVSVPKQKKTVSAGGFSMDEVSKHTTKGDCWVVLHGRVLNVSNFLSEHPGGELAILTFAGKDATAEFDMIHPPDVIEKYAPDAVIGMLGGGSVEEEDDEEEDEGDSPEGSFTMEEVAKHNKKGDVWVVLNGKVLNVSNFLSQHPGGELAILTFAGKDATAEFDMIHPPDVVEKYAPDAIIGTVGTAKAKKTKGSAKATAVVSKDKGDAAANLQAWGDWRVEAFDDTPGVFLINVRAYVNAAYHLSLTILYEICATIFSAKNFKISGDRTGLTRSAIFLIFFIVVHAVGNLHVFKGPDDFNGYGYFYVRLYWTGFGLPANIVEEYVLLSALLHVFVGLKRTWDTKLSMNLMSGALSLAISGLALLTFMTIHLFQFRFGDTEKYYLRPPRLLVNYWPTWIATLTLFWTDDKTVQPVPVRNIFKLEYDVLSNEIWAGFYILAVLIFMTHASLGWQKVTMAPSFGIPKKHQGTVKCFGYLIFLVIGAIYISFPLFVQLTKAHPNEGWEQELQR